MLHGKMVNGNQTRAQRRAKYAYCRKLGFTPAWSRICRDWDMRYIKWFYQRWIDPKGMPTSSFSAIRNKVIKERNRKFYGED